VGDGDRWCVRGGGFGRPSRDFEEEEEDRGWEVGVGGSFSLR
jgi:hypothetical protein